MQYETNTNNLNYRFMKTNDVNLKRVLLLLFTFTTICSWAQTPAWQQQLDKLDKEADLLYEKGNWKKIGGKPRAVS